MFLKDESGNLLIAASGTTVLEAPWSEPPVITGPATTGIPAELVEPTPVEEAKNDRVKTLRDYLYEQEPWEGAVDQPARLHPGIRRLMERRINRTLDAVANWMLSVVEERRGDDMTLVVLLELAESVRLQIAWPEREAQKPEKQR